MTPRELQIKIDKIIDRGFKPTRKQKITSILLIVHSLGFESVLAHALKIRFKKDDINDIEEIHLDELFDMAKTWRYQADRGREQEDQGVVVNFRSSD